MFSSSQATPCSILLQFLCTPLFVFLTTRNVFLRRYSKVSRPRMQEKDSSFAERRITLRSREIARPLILKILRTRDSLERLDRRLHRGH